MINRYFSHKGGAHRRAIYNGMVIRDEGSMGVPGMKEIMLSTHAWTLQQVSVPM